MRRASIVTEALRAMPSFVVLAWIVLLGSCAGTSSEVRAERVASSASDPTGNHSAGAFFNDGGDADVRARTESFFELDDVTNGLQYNASRGLDNSGTTQQLNPAALGTIGEGAGSPPVRMERRMIYTGSLVLDAQDPEQVLETLIGRAEEVGGYLASRRDQTVVVRVPAGGFAAFVDATKTMGRVVRESMNAQDVTEDYTDLEIRLANAKASRERLIALLEKATEMKDVLAIEKELSRVTEEIERFEGKLRVMKDRIAFATLSVSLVVSDEAPVEDVEPQRRPSRFDWVRAVGAEEVWRGF